MSVNGIGGISHREKRAERARYTATDTAIFSGCKGSPAHAGGLKQQHFCNCFRWLTNSGGGGRMTANCNLAGELGFEPRQTESESVVLPLHHSPIICQRTQCVTAFCCAIACNGILQKSRPRRSVFYSPAPGLGKRRETPVLRTTAAASRATSSSNN